MTAKTFLGFRKYEIIASSCATFFIIAGIIMWATFWPIFISTTANILQLQPNHDESLKYTAFMFANPPMKNVMKFIFFNVTNPDEVVFYGAKPELIETGGYGFLESEQKKYTKFNDDKTRMFYQNYKKYLYSPENSDSESSYDDFLVFPNPAATGAVATVFGPNTNYANTTKTIISIGMVLLGEYPMISKRVGDALFEGFDDPLLDIAHSGIFTTLLDFFSPGNDILTNIVPPMDSFAYMDGYNNSYDENYWINTGTKDINKIGYVESWADMPALPESFWPTPESRKIIGADSGSLSKMQLKESDELPFFFSFMCRSFKKTFVKRSIVSGIKSMIFSVPEEDFDTTLEKNVGFRYKNLEKVDYYPEWPGCPNVTCNDCQFESCRLCCGRNIVNGTYLLPPGMFPLVCYPGHNKEPPFTVIISAPHFLYSPKVVQQHLSGMNPDPEKHTPMSYHHERISGTVLQVDARFQVNLPVVNNKETILTSHLPNVIIPLFYESARATLDDFVYDKIRFGFIIVPRIIEYVKFVLIFIGIAIFTTLLVIRLQTKRNITPISL